ncbi:tRNA-(ms[2]io[6]A)-hydroxylase [Legionella nagasakiensis]|uniref:tRNA-(ms[2]io[6]A)-hydroxylase n=1 Tax=Legionella nagasakiensis TaxID=535290 RepID=UPI001054CB7B|nr:tRNA-(ms[2]io[6]A)-hydroxylase [Legionella nagasakiensis]
MVKPEVPDIQILIQFLKTPTPTEWLKQAMIQLPLLLIDHAHCERKAAATAINLISKYPEKRELVTVMSPLAREELLHFEKVMTLLKERKIAYRALQPSAYAQRLHKKVTIQCTNSRLCDQLIIGAIIEARSCERFSALVPMLEDRSLAKFYASLVKSEARHFQDYLRLANFYGKNIETRLEQFITLENELICSRDGIFRFHSGIPLEAS